MPQSKSKKAIASRKTVKSERLLYLVIVTILMGALFFYTGEYNLIKNLPILEYHRFASLFGQLTITIASATLVMASLCFVLERQDARWNRIFRATSQMFLYNTIGIMVGATLYAILTVPEKRDPFTIAVCVIILVFGATIINARPRIEKTERSKNQ